MPRSIDFETAVWMAVSNFIDQGIPGRAATVDCSLRTTLGPTCPLMETNSRHVSHFFYSSNRALTRCEGSRRLT